MVWNDECYRLFGQNPETCIPSYETWLQALHPNDREACLTSVSQAIENHQELAHEYRVIHPNGSVHWVTSLGQAIYDSTGRPKSMMGICLDITTRKIAEEVLRSSHEELERRVKKRTAEIQRVNERLRQEIEVRRGAEETLELERQKLFALLDALPVYVCLLAPDYSVTFANREWRARFGEVDGRRCFEILLGLHEPCGDCPIFQIIETQLPLELERLGPDGRVYQTFIYPFSDVDSSPFVLKMGLDITEQKRAKKALQESEARLAEAQRIAHMGHWEWIIPTNKIVWSDEIYRIFQLTHHDFNGSFEALLSHVHPDDKKIVQEHVAEALAGKKPYSIDHRIVFPHGAVSWVHEEGVVDFNGDGKPVRMLGTVQDLTKIRQTEEALRESEQGLRDLTSKLLTAQEAERRRISLGLHDELGQALMILKFQLSTMKDQLPEDNRALKGDCEELLHYLDGLIDKVRQLSRDLSPPTILEELGLGNALKYLIEEYSKHYDIPQRRVDMEEIDDLFSKPTQINIYRIFQEALTNIGRHAQATHISIEIKKADNDMSFIIRDDGKGFDPGRKTGIGVAAMTERVNITGGEIEIQSQKGRGTRITFNIPIELK
ncbi:MAG: sensor histidine kinase [Desulfobaccales bacterium]